MNVLLKTLMFVVWLDARTGQLDQVAFRLKLAAILRPAPVGEDWKLPLYPDGYKTDTTKTAILTQPGHSWGSMM
jgi:hypothetical protein